MLQNARVTAFTTIFELLRENQEQKGGGGVKLPPPTQIKVNSLGYIMKKSCKFWIK